MNKRGVGSSFIRKIPIGLDENTEKDFYSPISSRSQPELRKETSTNWT